MCALNTAIAEPKANTNIITSGLKRFRFPQPNVLKPKLAPKTRTVGQLIHSAHSGKSPTALLGECADGTPFIIELGDPQMGAILIGCDSGAGKTHHLQLLADSAIKMNTLNSIELAVITFKPDEWQSWRKNPEIGKHLQGIYAWYDPWAEELINNLIDLAETRHSEQQNGTGVLLLLDDISFIEELGYEAQVNLHWLLEYGNQAGVYIVGTMKAQRTPQFRFWVDPFRTRIVGKIMQASSAEIIAQRNDSAADSLDPAMFRIRTGSRWRTYRLPLLGD